MLRILFCHDFRCHFGFSAERSVWLVAVAMGCASSRERSRQPTSRAPTSTRAHLRIVHVTDVYILDNFPSLCNLIKAKRADVEQSMMEDLGNRQLFQQGTPLPGTPLP